MSIKCSHLWNQAGFLRRPLVKNERIFRNRDINKKRACQWDAYLKFLGVGLLSANHLIEDQFHNFNPDRDTFVHIPKLWQHLEEPIVQRYDSTLDFIQCLLQNDDINNPKTTILCPTNKMVTKFFQL